VPLSGYPKLLSHRARGFGWPEATPEAIGAALRSGVRHVELDTRVDVTGEIFVRHSPRVRTSHGAQALHGLSGDTLTRHGIAKLADVLQIAAATMDETQTLCLDIKDYGFEREHVALIEQYGLAARTVFVSWIPGTLAVLHEIAPEFRLILSHINLQFLPFGARLVETLLGTNELRALDFIALGPGAAEQELRHKVGFQHGLIARDLPADYIRFLAGSGGGICVPLFCVCDALDAWCERHSLRQWVFTANDAATYRRLCRRPAIDVIFSDDPLKVTAGLTENSEGGAHEPA